MGGNKKEIPLQQSNSTGALSAIENKVFGFNLPRAAQTPYISLKYIDTDFECFSDWSKEELKEFTAFIKKLSQQDWDTIFKSGGGHKSGLGMTFLPTDLFTSTQFAKLDEQIKMFELRVSQKLRVHGFRTAGAFFLMFLDREHRICQK